MTFSRTNLMLVATVSVLMCCAESARSQVLSPDAVAGSAEITYDEAAISYDETATTGSEATTTDEKDGFWSKLSMPKLSMPKVSMPKLSMPSWPKNEDGIAKSPFTPISQGVSSGMQAISTGTSKAWQGTKNMFTFGGDEAKTKATPVATSSTPRRSLWDRIKGEEPEPDGPQTVAEWMSQPRPSH